MKTFSQIRVHRLSSGVLEWTFLLQKNYRLLVSKKYYRKPLLGNSSKQVNIYHLALLCIFIFTISRSVFGLYLSFFVWPWKLLLLNKFHSIFGILLVKNSWTSTLRMTIDINITSSLWHWYLFANKSKLQIKQKWYFTLIKNEMTPIAAMRLWQ